MSSLLTLNYFTPFPSFPIADFEQVNICWEIYLTFCLFDICFNVSTGGRQDLKRSNAGNSVIFLISHAFDYLNNSFKEHWKVCINATTRSWGHKNKAGDCREFITSDHLPFQKTITLNIFHTLF